LDAGGGDFFCRFRGAVVGVTAEATDSSGDVFFRLFRGAGVDLGVVVVFVVVIDGNVDDCHDLGLQDSSI
jgi:hypothetical protein